MIWIYPEVKVVLDEPGGNPNSLPTYDEQPCRRFRSSAALCRGPNGHGREKTREVGAILSCGDCGYRYVLALSACNLAHRAKPLTPLHIRSYVRCCTLRHHSEPTANRRHPTQAPYLTWKYFPKSKKQSRCSRATELKPLLRQRPLRAPQVRMQTSCDL